MRLEPARQAYPAPAPEPKTSAEAAAAATAAAATAAAAEDGEAAPPEAGSPAEAAAPVGAPVDPKASSLNPEAKPFVPAAASAPAAAPAASAPAGADKGGGDRDGEDGDDDDDDDDEAEEEDEAADGASEATKATEGNEGPLVEVTRWAERGVGQIRLLVHKPLPPGDSGALPYPRLVMRVEHVGRLILNESLLPSMAPAERVSDTSIRFALVSAVQGPQSYLLRVKTPVEAEQLVSQINATIPQAAAVK